MQALIDDKTVLRGAGARDRVLIRWEASLLQNYVDNAPYTDLFDTS